MNRTPSKNGERNVRELYRRIMRFFEYYILFCFVMIMILPLFDYSWVPPVTRFFYFTGFPLLLFLLIVSLFKDSLLDFLEKKYSSTNTTKQRK